MSARYLNSPALHLSFADSRLQRFVLCIIFACELCACWQVSAAGYSGCAWLLLGALGLLWGAGSRKRVLSSALGWHEGGWFQFREGRREAIEVLRGTRCLPGVIYLTWRRVATGQRQVRWIFCDALEPAQYRRLRSRLALER